MSSSVTMPARRYAGTVPGVRAIVVGNATDLDAGFVGGHLRRRGYQFTEAQRERPADWPLLDGVDLVLTLGSEWNVYRPETARCVEAEAALVRDVVGRRIPLFAICFGTQVLCHALGGTVARAPAPEIGWFSLIVERHVASEDGEEPVRHAAGSSAFGGRIVDGPPVAAGPWMEWHDDVVTAPPGFDVLARTDACAQLIRGPRALGTQFHPEATETMIRDWIEHGGAEAYRRHGGDPDALLVDTRTNVTFSRPAAEALVDWFLEDIAGA
jgi:GMP synthase-like glutamine amidotransferase